MSLTEERLNRIHSVVSNRQFDLTVILENVHDPHNIGAVLRTCDSVGIAEIYVLYTDEVLRERGIKVGEKSSSGTRQWIDIHYFTDLDACFKRVKERYDNIYGTVIDEQSVELYNLNLTGKLALLFGNEKDGVSEEAREFIDGNFIIPQMGFVKSLNISVACAVSLYECYRQRSLAGRYGLKILTPDQENLQKRYVKVHMDKKKS